MITIDFRAVVVETAMRIGNRYAQWRLRPAVNDNDPTEAA